uniref:Disintegrin and metalloproteinase domain-containing protein 18-like n=1 Tax=Geotrypetes seraphini TaxID=260995 RepID=A0A6P8QZ52_GEOSA|nr:disintegrin and metalloproteinase domain-containing protein 18-like [Geotrypetes seraphini]
MGHLGRFFLLLFLVVTSGVCSYTLFFNWGLCDFIFPGKTFASAAKNFRSSLNSYVIIIPKKIISKVNEDKGSMLYAIRIDGKDRIVHLEKQELLPRGFTVSTYSQEGERQSSKPLITNDCYYQGYIIDIPSSVVTLRTCSGIRGLVELMNDSYIIEPLESSPGFEHLMYKMDDVYKDFSVLAENDTEGVNQQIEFTQARKPIQERRYVELYVVATKELDSPPGFWHWRNQLHRLLLFEAQEACLSAQCKRTFLQVWDPYLCSLPYRATSLILNDLT